MTPPPTPAAVDLTVERRPLTPGRDSRSCPPSRRPLRWRAVGRGRLAPPTLDAGTGLRATQACLTSLASQAEARPRVERFETACSSGAGECVRTVNETDAGTTTTLSYSANDGSETFSVVYTEKEGGEITSLDVSWVGTNGQESTVVTRSVSVDPTPRNTADANAARVLPQSAPSVTPTMNPAVWAVLRAVEDGLGLDWGTLAPRLPFQVNHPRPGGQMQCEAFAGGASQPVGILRGAEASTPASGVGPGVPGLVNSDDAIAHCLCQGGALGRQLAGAMGFGCPGPASDYAKRTACFESDPAAQPPPECVTCAQETGVDVAGMCASTVRCPEGTAASGGVIDGRLSRGCARTGGGGSTAGGECSVVQCSGPGEPMPASASACWGQASPITMTPRADPLSDLRVRSGDAVVPALSIPTRLDGRQLREQRRLATARYTICSHRPPLGLQT